MTHRSTQRLWPLALILLAAAYPAARGDAQDLEERITALLSQMTMEEKIEQLHASGGFTTAMNSRLAIPGFVMADGPHGVRDGLATSFPVGIGMASTWDTSLAYRIGEAMGREFTGKGKNQGLGPCLDIDRDPRNGRSPETGGEDPYLCARITSAVVRGMQSSPLVATVKHYNANHRENGRTSNNITASQRVLHEQAGLAFRTAVQEGGVFCVMNAYNLINGEKCAENPNLLTTILRQHWGFPYYVVSDWGSIWNSEKAIKAGCDICMGSDNYKNDLPGLVSSGAVPDSVIDAAVRRVLRTKILSGMLDYQPPGNPDDVNSTSHQQLCLEAGRKSLVLLKNEGSVLPLSKTLNHLALIGPSAAVAQIDGSGSAYVTPFYTISPKQGIEATLGASRVSYARGCDINSADTSGFAAARDAAQSADAVVFCGGLDPSQEGEGFDRVGGSISLPGKQQDLINSLAAVNPDLIVVLFSGGVCGIDRCVSSIRGLIYAFYPGQEGGRALADVLFGDVNPGGKMPVTMPKGDAQLPPWDDDLNNDFGCGYRWFDQMGITPQFAFGFGLSYTTFRFSNLVLSSTAVNPGIPVSVSLDVTNTGLVGGDEVVQLYVSAVSSAISMPVKELKGFRRVSLDPGATETVTFTLGAEELYYYDETTNQYNLEPGTYVIGVGGSSDDLPLSGSFEVLNGPRKPDLCITSLRMVPPYPLPGQEVRFLAAVKNQGSLATAGGVPLKVAFSVDGSLISWSDDFTASIPPGGMALIAGNAGPAGVNSWTPVVPGLSTVEAAVDPDNALDECVESNNTLAAALRTYEAPLPNLALHKSVTVTSVEAPGLEGTNAVDGNMGTRWSSAFSDPQILMVDLGQLCHIDDVVIYWETAYASEYSLSVTDGSHGWNEVEHVQGGDGGMDRISVGADARQIMMAGIKRGTPYGYSIYEFVVHGSPATEGSIQDAAEMPHEYQLGDCYPNPFNPSTVIPFALPSKSRVKVEIFNILGESAAVLLDGDVDAGYHTLRWEAALGSGLYFCRMSAVSLSEPMQRFVGVKRMALLR